MARITILTILAVLTAGCVHTTAPRWEVNGVPCLTDPKAATYPCKVTSVTYYGCDDPRKPKDGLCRGADGQLHRAGQGNFVWSNPKKVSSRTAARE